MAKKLIVGEQSWNIPDADAANIVKQVKDAVSTSGSAELQLLDGAGRAVTVLLNAKAAATVALDLDQDPRPGEIG
jgi:hypothetical protein